MEVGYVIDIIFNSLFFLESVLKVVAYGFLQDSRSYLRDAWNQLDFFIVVTSLFDMIYTDSGL